MLKNIKCKVRKLCVRLANSILMDDSTQAILLNIMQKKMQDDVSQMLITQIFHKLLQDPLSQSLMPQIFHKLLMDNISQSVMTNTFNKILQDDSVRKEIWKIANIRPEGQEFSYAFIPNDIREEIFKIATTTTAEYVNNNMSHLHGVFRPLDLLTFALSKTDKKGLFLECGVYSGTTINHIASQVNNTIHGFDSFQGLPEEWGHVAAGTFSTHGVLPEVRDNVQLHIGWFNETLPEFVKKYSEKISFLHIDSDIYTSAKTILTCLQKQIKKGTIIVFDEYFNYPGWENHEYKAFQEFARDYNYKYGYIGYSGKGFSVALVIQ